jgi:hypothetical protein
MGREHENFFLFVINVNMVIIRTHDLSHIYRRGTHISGNNNLE